MGAGTPGLDFRQADAHELPLGDSSFDAVVGNLLIMHLGRPERAVEGFVRVVAPGGRLALTACLELPVSVKLAAGRKPE